MTTITELRDEAENASNLFKALESVAFLAPADAPVIEKLTSATGEIVELPESYLPIGLVSEDGWNFESDVSNAETRSHGHLRATRQDVESVEESVTVTVQEALRKNVLGLAYDIEDSAFQVDAESGEVKIVRPSVPAKRRYRLLVIASDGSGANRVYKAKYFPSAESAGIPSEAFNTEVTSFELTLTPMPDKEVGSSVVDFIGGPGFKARAAEYGF